MPYCSTCGTEVAVASRFCQKCGTPQPGASAGPAEGFLSTLSPRNAALLCYIPVLGWIPAIVVLASTTFRENRFVRFHAFQGLYLFVAWLMVEWVLSPILGIVSAPLKGVAFTPMFVTHLLKVVLFGSWIVMLVKTSREEYYRLPIVGELAERSLSEA